MTKYEVIFCIVFSILAVWFDWRTFRIPNRFILFGYAIALLIQILSAKELFFDKLIGIAAGAIWPLFFMGIVWKLGGIGAGDVKLLSVLGVILGAKNILSLSITALFIGAGMGILAKLIRKNKIHFSIAILAGVFLHFIQTGVIF